MDIVQLKSFINSTINDLNKMLDTMCSIDQNSLKRAELITYWLKDYKKYLEFEKVFTPKKLKEYKRGDVLKVNLGFKIGNEEGGLHYAIVLDNKNARSSGVITIIPLSSIKPNEILSKYDVPLGDELYSKVTTKYQSISKFCMNEIIRLDKEINYCYEQKKIISKEPDINLEQKLSKKIAQLKNDLIKLKLERKNMDKIHKEMKKMKSGTKALVGQITTISKMRIFDPKYTTDILSNIKISPNNLDLITKKVNQLYVFSIDKKTNTAYNDIEDKNNAV